MNRRRWFVGKKMAAWCRMILMILLAADLGVSLLAGPKGGSGRRQEYAGQRAVSAAVKKLPAAEEMTIGPPEEAAAEEAAAEEAAAEEAAAEEAAAEETAVEGTAAKKTVALTFDDGPHPVFTPKLLDGLRKRRVCASFFLIGQNIDGNEEIVRQMYADGHLIGNHSQNHLQLTSGNAEDACAQIRYTNEKIREITGQEPDYIRPPFGSWSDELGSLIPMTVALWNLDPLDWKTQDRAAVVRYVENHAEDGSIILLHDVYESSVEAALEIIDTLTAEGYNFVTVDEMLIE